LPSLFIFHSLGDLYTISGKFQKGIVAYKNALAIDLLSKEMTLDRIDHSIDCKGALALLYMQIGDYIEAITLFEETVLDVKHLREHGNKFLAYLHGCLSFLYAESGNRILSKQHLMEALKFLNELQRTTYTWIKIYGFLYLSRTLITHEMFLDSEDVLGKLQSYAISKSYAFAEGLTNSGYANLYIALSNYELGIEKFTLAEQIFIKVGAKYELADTYFQLGLIYYSLGSHEQADDYKIKSLELFKQMEVPRQVERINKLFDGFTS